MLNDAQIQARAEHWVQSVSARLQDLSPVKVTGRVKQILGTLIEATIPAAKMSDLCAIHVLGQAGAAPILAEVVGFTQEVALLSALNPPIGVAYGDIVEPLGCQHQIAIDEHIYGQVFDGMGRLLGSDEAGIFYQGAPAKNVKSVIAEATSPMDKPRICTALATGVKSIDSLLTLGQGQRIGLFAGAGCGKTTLLASLARGAQADVTVFALVGERGRELKEFLDHEMDDELRSRSILVCATSDKSSMERARAAFTATAIAEALRDQGKKVLLLVDSLTRFARAQREIGLAAGEPPAKGGFPPSVYTMLPRLIERAGKTSTGSITAVYTILMEGDSMADPIADEAKSLLDGHIVLSRQLAEKGHYPAIDVLMSLSRTMPNVVTPEHLTAARRARELLSTYKELELLIKLGEYQAGNDQLSDLAVEKYPHLIRFLQQDCHEMMGLDEAVAMLESLLS